MKRPEYDICRRIDLEEWNRLPTKDYPLYCLDPRPSKALEWTAHIMLIGSAVLLITKFLGVW